MCRAPYYNKEQGCYCPCGQCEYCLGKRIQNWTVRMMHQYETSGRASFVTLTYRNEDLPQYNSLVKDDLQKYFKRVRYHYEKPVKYYACGEYGEETSRPHYHCIIFGIDPPEYNLLNERENLWSFGHTFVGSSVAAESCAYVAKYVTKMIRGKGIDWSPRQKPFQLQSQGLGKDWCDTHADELKKNSTSHKTDIRKECLGIIRNALESTRTTIQSLLGETTKK